MANNLYKALRYAVAAGVLAAGSGCELAGVAADRTVGPTVNAKYVPSKTESMLVLVESYGLSLDSGIEAQHMTLVLRKSLTDQKIATMVDPQSLERLRDADPGHYKPMTIADIGRRVGARQVLYVNIWRSEIIKPAGSGQMRGQMEAIVKIVDTTTGDTRWPMDAPSDTVQITTDWTPETADTTDNDFRAKMADQMAEDISKLFHDYHPDQEPMPKVNLD